MTQSLIGDLSITMEDGTVLTARTDVALAEKWAAFVYGERWSTMTFGERTRETSDALRELRRAAS